MVVEPIPIIGRAWSTALGDDIDDVWDALCANQTGIAEYPVTVRLKNNLAASIDDLRVKSPSDRFFQLAKKTLAASIQSIDLSLYKRIVLIVGTSFGARLDDPIAAEYDLDHWGQQLAEVSGIQKVIALSTACSSGSDVVYLAGMLIAAGEYDLCICGGVDVLTDAKRLAHTALGTLSSGALKPFDKARTGTVLGEGAGFLVLAKTIFNQQTIYGYYCGAGSANDGAGLTAPDSQAIGAKYAIIRACRESGISPDDIGIINAHGSGTRLNDQIELDAYCNVFRHQPVIFATKGAFGHSLGATGSIELIALIESLRRQEVPPITGLDNPIGNFFMPVLKQKTSIQARYGMSLTLGFGGFDTSIIVKVA
jgi:3-oxoacyl-[acyl-carrier-protein] synthase II